MDDDSNWGRNRGQPNGDGRGDVRRRQREPDFGRGAWPSEDRGGFGQETGYGYGREGQREPMRDDDRRRDYGYGREGTDERYGRPAGYGYGRQGDESRGGGQGDGRGPGYGHGSGGYGPRQDAFGPRYVQPRDERQGERDFIDRATDEVQSWFGDDDAERRRRMDDRRGGGEAWRAGPGEFRGRGPRNYTRSDERVRDDLNDRLSDDPHLDATDIEVAVAQGEVTLSGLVQDRFAKRHAEDIADRVSGVRHVQNNLRVRGQVGGRPGDGPAARPGGAEATDAAGETSTGLGGTGRRTP